jgi:hypothetical protein
MLEVLVSARVLFFYFLFTIETERERRRDSSSRPLTTEEIEGEQRVYI